MQKSIAALAITCLTGAGLFAQVDVSVVTSNLNPTIGGAAFSWTITVQNFGAAGSLVVTHPLPPGAVFASNIVSVTGTPLSCTGPAIGTNGIVVCSNPAYPVAGSSIIVVIGQYEPDQSSGVRGTLVNAVMGNNQDFDSLAQNILTDAQLQLSMTATPQAKPGSDVFYKISVQNIGSSSAINATVTVTLPVTVTFGSVFGTGPFHDVCTFNPATRQLTCLAKFVRTGTHNITLGVKTPPDPPNYTLNMSATLTAGVGTTLGTPALTSTIITPYN